MNLDTTPVHSKMTINGVLLTGNGQAQATTYVVQHQVLAVDAQQQEELNRLVLSVIGVLDNKVWNLPAFSDSRHPAILEPVLTLAVNFMGSIREAFAHHIRFAIYATAAAQGILIHTPDIKVVDPGVWMQPEGFTVGVGGTVFSGSFSFQFGEHYRDDCSTCQQGKNLLRLSINQLNGQLIVDPETEDGDGSFAWGQCKFTPHPDLLFHFGVMPEGATAQDKFKNWFTWTNQGALEMAHVQQVFFLGV